MFTSQQLQTWRKRNLYYYKDLERFYQFWVEPNAKVLEVGTGLGDLLNIVNPKYGLGIDINPLFVEKAKEKYDHLDFEVIDAEEFVRNQLFDYILLANTISYIGDIEKVFNNLHKLCHSSTRVILTFHNPGWELILRLATLFNQRMPVSSLNWLNLEDIENLFHLTNFEVIERGKRCLFPKNIPLVSGFLNKFIAPLPFFNQFCLTEYIIARPCPDTYEVKENIGKLTCSVIIPARNESGNIESCITRMPKFGKHTEIIFIEGHSSDNTWEEIQRVQNKYQDQWDIKIYQQTGKGKGNAVREGFAMAQGDILIILDSDLTVRPEDLIYFFNAIALGHCEFANGCRLIYPVSDDTMPWLNRMANRFFAWLLSYLLNTKIKDSLCGTKVLRRTHYERIAKNRSYFGDFDPFGDFDLLFGASKLGLKIQDIPVRYMPRTYGQSNIQHIKEGLVLLKMCLYAAKKIKFI
jgi:SAM-dependent methyltransferase